MWSKLGIAAACAGLVALLAFFQARALAELLGGALAAQHPLPTRFVADASSLRATEAKRTGRDILQRNPFDSAWRSEQAVLVPKGPLEAPRCASLSLAVVSESDDAEWSLASLVVPATGKPKLVRRGDRVDDRDVVHVGENPLLGSPAVWLSANGELCQIVLRERARGVPEPARDPELTPLPNPKIRRLSEREHAIDRSLLEDLFAQQHELAGHVRATRTREGRPAAQLVRVTPGSILSQAGFAEGDLLLGVDGRDMSTPERALPVMIELRRASRFGVDVERGGRRFTLGFSIR